jgi:pimeloyl-ACP methyl ester carboxylesterase
MMTRLLNALLYFPSRRFYATPADVGLRHEDVWLETEDRHRLHAWWIPAPRQPAPAHVLLCHGNAGNIGDRVLHARLLTGAGLDVFLFDYRGFGRSDGSSDEEGTYRDARAARAALLRRPTVDAGRIVYLGESVGGAVALALALEAPPLGLVLQSAFTSVRDMGRMHYPFIPAAMVPDAYPNLRRIAQLRSPVLVIHGDRDEIVPVAHGHVLFDAAPPPKRIEIVRGAGHNDLLEAMGASYGTTIAGWARALAPAVAVC